MILRYGCQLFGLPCWLGGKEPVYSAEMQAGDLRSTSGLGRALSPREKENGNSFLYACLENPNPWGHKTAKQNWAMKQEQEQKYHINVKEA